MSSENGSGLHRARCWVEESAKALAGAAAGGMLGYLLAWYGRYQANAAVAVRPELANVGFIEAVVTSHGGDWVFYQFPMAMTAAIVLILGAIGFVSGVKA